MTIIEEAGRACTDAITISGKSSETKPIEKYEGKFIADNSYYLEKDTGNVFVYDAEEQIWYQI